MVNNKNNYWNITQVAKNDYGNIDGFVAERPGSSTWHIPLNELIRELLLGLNKFFVKLDGKMHQIFVRHLNQELQLNAYDTMIRKCLLSLPITKMKN